MPYSAVLQSEVLYTMQIPSIGNREYNPKEVGAVQLTPRFSEDLVDAKSGKTAKKQLGGDFGEMRLTLEIRNDPADDNNKRPHPDDIVLMGQLRTLENRVIPISLVRTVGEGRIERFKNPRISGFEESSTSRTANSAMTMILTVLINGIEQ